MSLRKRSLMYLLVVLGLLAASIAVIAVKPTILGLDLQGGSEVILQASDTPDAKVTPDALKRAVGVINDRVNRLGTTEPEIQVQGGDKIRVALPGVEDTAVVADLVKSAVLQFYVYEDNLVGYQKYPGAGPQAGVNPTTDLYALIGLAKSTPAGTVAPTAQSSVYLFRNNDTHEYVFGPSANKEALLKQLRASATKQDVVAEYDKNPKAFEFQTVPKGFVILTDAQNGGNDCGSGGQCVLLRDNPGASGNDVKGANLGFDQLNEPTVQLQFSGSGQKRFAALTRAVVDGGRSEGRPASDPNGQFHHFAIALDGRIISTPFVDYNNNPTGIDSGNAEISGGFTEKSAKTLANQIATGSIPIRLDQVSLANVGASLGEQSLRQGLIAGMIGLGVVVLLLIGYYRVLGLIAALSLGVYALYFWALAKIVPIALTLPGIAGVILTIGVAADASVVIFERVREEARAGRPARTAILNGYKRGITAIIDANIVTLVTAIFIFLLSTSGPRGFAFTLILGVLISLFTAIIATQSALGLLVETKLFKNEKLMGLHAREIKWKMDFVGRWKLWLGISFIPMILGLFIIGFRGIEQGIDFTGGTRLSVVFNQQTPNDNDVRSAVAAFGQPDAKVQAFDRTIDGKQVKGFDIETKFLSDTQAVALENSLSDKFGATERQSLDSVGPTFGRDIVKNALFAILFSFIAIIIYLSFRFELKLALPALASVVHDVWLAITIYSIAGKEVTSATVAALLTILGYSLYDVVIVFDRIRENEPLMRGRPYREVVNRSVHETLTRSIITMILTLLPVLVLYLFGGKTLHDFSFALLVGILSGGVSSIFISAPLAALWKEREPDQRKQAARRAKKEARRAAVDADIVDVDALARAEAAMGFDPNAEAPAIADDGMLALEEATAGDPSPEAPAEPDDGGGSSVGRTAPPSDGGPAKPPERARRHRNVQRKRRR